MTSRNEAINGNQINVRQLLDNSPLSTFQKFIIFLGFLIVLADGFDVVIMGFVGPALKEAWGWSNQDLAPVLSAALFGLTFGALTAGPLGDKFGRRKVLCTSVMIFGVFTLLVATATSQTSFIIYRFIAGFAMGGIMPMVATLVKEFSPATKSSLMVTMVFAGFTGGAAGGGFIAKWMIPHFGWESVFILGGIFPIIISIIMGLTLPESLTFLVHKGHSREKIRKIVDKCVPGVTNDQTTFIVPEPPQVTDKNPIRIALSPFYRVGSIVLWMGYFCHLFMVYLLGSWMPTMMKDSGMSFSDAAIISALFQLGGPIGSIMQGWLMDKLPQNKVVISAYVTGCLYLLWMSNVGDNFALLCLTSFLVGGAFNGGGTAFNALSSNFFPLAARATGNSWMHGIGRTGAILSAFAGAWMLDAGWNFSTVALALMATSGVIIILLIIKDIVYRNSHAEHHA